MKNDVLQEISTILAEYGVNDENLTSAIAHWAEGPVSRRLHDGSMSPDDPSYGLNIALVMVCLVCAAAASGLTQGLLSLDYMEMKIKSESGTEREKVNARKVLPIISKHHLLLVTLMLWNATAMEALPIFLDKLVPEWLAIVLSVTLILIVGEIVPAAVLTGPKQLEIAGALVPLVWFVMGIFFFVAYPMSVLLDNILGHEEGITQYNRREMATLVRLQHEEGASQNAHENMDLEEVAIIEGALTFRNIPVSQVMTPIKDAFMVAAHERLNYKTLAEIFKAGYSRIPVYETGGGSTRDGGNNPDVIGLILVKDLIFVDPVDETPIRNFVQLFGRQPTTVFSDESLGDTLNGFRAQASHMALVREIVESTGAADSTYRNVGIVTLEDIIETILGAEIEDEHDADDQRQALASKSQLRDFDMARLRLLNSKMDDSSIGLGEEEVRAVAAHLLANVQQIQTLFRNDMESVRELVRRGMLVELKRKSLNSVKPDHEDIIYRKNVPTTLCTLILNGKITVVAGRDEFSLEQGPWSILAPDCLISGDAQYSPDFFAYVSSESVRLVRLSIYSDFGRGGATKTFDALDQRKHELGLVELTQHKKHTIIAGAVTASSGIANAGGVISGGNTSSSSTSNNNRANSPNSRSAASYVALPGADEGVVSKGGVAVSKRPSSFRVGSLSHGALAGSVRSARERDHANQPATLAPVVPSQLDNSSDVV